MYLRFMTFTLCALDRLKIGNMGQ